MLPRKQCQRLNVPGHAHALTFSCFQRRPFLSKDRSRQWLIEAIDRARSRHGYHLWAYVIMPEHVHMLVWPTATEYSISALLNTVKQSVSKRALPWIREHAPEFLNQLEDRQPNGLVHHRFWQRGGGFDRNVVEPATVHHEIEYIHRNPVKRGLCARPEEWYWSSAADYAGRTDGPLRIDRESVPSWSGP
jgi:putative transposase